MPRLRATMPKFFKKSQLHPHSPLATLPPFNFYPSNKFCSSSKTLYTFSCIILFVDSWFLLLDPQITEAGVHRTPRPQKWGKTLYYHICKMLYSQLKFVQSFAYLWLFIQFSIQRGYESHGRERDTFWPFCEWSAIFSDQGIWQRLLKGIKNILYHYTMQKLFIFSIILRFHPKNEDHQDLNIEPRKLNENNRHGKQKHWKGLNLTITSFTSMVTSINGKSYQISYRCGVLNDCFVSSPGTLVPFSRFGYFRLVYIYSIFRIYRSSLFGWKRRIVKYKQFLHVIMIQSNQKYLFAISVKCWNYKTSQFVHKLAKTYSVAAMAFIPLLNGKLDIKS